MPNDRRDIFITHPSKINPVNVRILIKLSQNSTSPKALMPKVLIAMTNTMRMVTQAAELMVAFQNLKWNRGPVSTPPLGSTHANQPRFAYRMTKAPATIWLGLMIKYLQR